MLVLLSCGSQSRRLEITEKKLDLNVKPFEKRIEKIDTGRLWKKRNVEKEKKKTSAGKKKEEGGMTREIGNGEITAVGPKIVRDGIDATEVKEGAPEVDQE